MCLETGNHLPPILASVAVLRGVSEDNPEAARPPFFFQTACFLSPRPPPPPPSVHAQHDNCDDHPSAYPLDSHRNVNTRVGTRHPTSTTRDIRQCPFPTLSFSYFRYLDTSLFAVLYAFPVSPNLLVHSQEFARGTALQAASNSSKKWSLMTSFNAHTSP